MDTTSRRNRYIETGDTFARTISIRGFDCILDIGCGENLYKDIPNVIGIDNVGPHCDVLADMNELPYEDNSIDCVLAFGCLIFGGFPTPPNTDPIEVLTGQVREMHRVLRDGGWLYGRTSHTDILNNQTIATYGYRYGFNTIISKMITSPTSGHQRLYWEWVKRH